SLARESGMFAVETIQVEGASPALTAQVRQHLSRYNGRSLVTVDAGAVASHVDGLPALRQSVVDRAFPHTHRIRVVPETPVAVLRRGAESWLGSARGRLMAPLALRTHPAKP